MKPQKRRYAGRPRANATNVANALRAVEDGRRIVLVAGPAPDLAELATMLPAHAKVYADGHWPVVRLDGAAIHWGAQWHGQPSWSASEQGRFIEALTFDIARRFPGGTLLATPATTGRDLWLRSIDREWPTMQPETQRLVRSSSTQGRIELYPARTPKVAGLWVYDMRLAYCTPAILAELPIGEPVHLGAHGAGALWGGAPHARARYRATWQAPADWRHVGILPERQADGSMAFPLAGTGWVDGAELMVACRHGWRVELYEALHWERKGNPLRRWGDAIRAALACQWADPTLGPAMRHAWRAILIQSIGAWHGAARRVTVLGDEPPEGAENMRLLPDGRVAWTERTEAAWAGMSHPEWTAAIWARVRARLALSPTGGLLRVPAGQLVAARTDAIYTTAPQDWHDDGEPGRFRLKATAPAMAWPASSAELLRAVSE